MKGGGAVLSKILVTGGAGYIGSHTVRQLQRSGFEPVVFDNLSEGHAWAANGVKLIEGDLSNETLLRRVLRENSIAAVMHFAASTYVGESVTNPRKYFDNNSVNSLNLLGAMVDENVKTIVFSSTCATYGVPNKLPITEDEPSKPVNPYGHSKAFVERELESYGRAYGLRWAALRYFNASGADASGEIGEDHDPETHLIPLLIQAVLGVRAAVEIFGTDYPTPDGTPIRDYIHVTDLGNAHVLALRHLMQGGEPVAVNLGTGRGYSVRELIRCVESVAERPVPVKESPRREGDPPALVANPAKAREVLGWQAECSSIENIVGTAWRWHRKHEFEKK